VAHFENDKNFKDKTLRHLLWDDGNVLVTQVDPQIIILVQQHFLLRDITAGRRVVIPVRSQADEIQYNRRFFEQLKLETIMKTVEHK